ncbi:ParB/RepB/Spo0J family partition protein [Sphingopyxis sp. R3-92]|uniref:ParB/RepB/Spo0J family partition protein n=1 Tax=Sphingopyxis sp. R3-92 TaxID=3158553 RepID=UPI003EE6ED9D
MNAVTETHTAQGLTGVEIFVPLNKLRKSPSNARKVPHGEAAIEALAASIHHKGMIQNLVVEPEIKNDQPTGYYLVTAGEGRRQAQLLRAKRKQIGKAEPVRCWLDTSNDPSEVSLDENITRTNMHPADQFERFHELSVNRGWGAEEIGARFGVSAEVVKRRLRLGAVSPRLMDIYRQDGLTLDQLAAFAITDDHARQEQVFDNLSFNKEPWIIRRDLTVDKVPAHDRRAIFIGADAYVEAGGHITRDLFTEDDGGYFEDGVLLELLVAEKLRELAAGMLGEGWKWAEGLADFPHHHGMRRYYPQGVALPDVDKDRLDEATAEYDGLMEGCDDYDAMPGDVVAKVKALDAEIDAIEAKQYAYEADVIARGGVFVCLGSNGIARIERGFVRPEDEPQAEADSEERDESGLPATDPDDDQDDEGSEEEEEAGCAKPISDSLVRDLTAHRTLALRLVLGDNVGVAMLALTHAMVSDLFYHGRAKSCLEVRATSEALGTHADGIADTGDAEALAARHDGWGTQLPTDADDLWLFIAEMEDRSRDELLAHCVSLTVNAVKLPWERSVSPVAAADIMASAVDLDMARHWTPTARSYFGRVTKDHIAQAVSEAVSVEAADRIRPTKKADMADAAEQLVAGTEWLPQPLRTAKVESEADMVANDDQQDRYAIAAE